jgi:hypothetical protein
MVYGERKKMVMGNNLWLAGIRFARLKVLKGLE